MSDGLKSALTWAVILFVVGWSFYASRGRPVTIEDDEQEYHYARPYD